MGIKETLACRLHADPEILIHSPGLASFLPIDTYFNIKDEGELSPLIKKIFFLLRTNGLTLIDKRINLKIPVVNPLVEVDDLGQILYRFEKEKIEFDHDRTFNFFLVIDSAYLYLILSVILSNPKVTRSSMDDEENRIALFIIEEVLRILRDDLETIKEANELNQLQCAGV